MIRTKDALISEYAKQIASRAGWNIVEIKNSRLYICSQGKFSISKELQNPTQFVSLFKYVAICTLQHPSMVLHSLLCLQFVSLFKYVAICTLQHPSMVLHSLLCLTVRLVLYQLTMK